MKYKSGKEDLMEINQLVQASMTAPRALFDKRNEKIKEIKITTEYFRLQTSEPYPGKLHLKKRNNLRFHTKKNI